MFEIDFYMNVFLSVVFMVVFFISIKNYKNLEERDS